MIPLTKASVFDAMVALLEKKSVRFNRDMLDQYVNHRLPTMRSCTHLGKRVEKTTMSKDTLNNWVNAYISKHCFS
jgi:hypothetical protein